MIARVDSLRKGLQESGKGFAARANKAMNKAGAVQVWGTCGQGGVGERWIGADVWDETMLGGRHIRSEHRGRCGFVRMMLRSPLRDWRASWRCTTHRCGRGCVDGN